MAQVAFLRRALLAGVLLAVGPVAPNRAADPVPARTVLETSAALAWAEARAHTGWKGFRYTFRRDGEPVEVHWDAYGRLAYPLQTRMLLDLFKDVERNANSLDQALDRRAALALLGRRPLAEWADAALAISGPHREELLQWLAVRGWPVPAGSLDGYARLERPWTWGLGLHLDAGDRWRLQWLPAPALLPRAALAAPAGPVSGTLGLLPEPGALVHLAQLRPGLERLRALAGAGVTGALVHGNRAGFLLDHVVAWLDRAAPALGPVARREAWIAHYWAGGDRGLGTLAFLPGDLPARTRLALELLKLNPLSAGARVRTATWRGDGGRAVEVTQVRAAGGVLNLAPVPDGTLLCDSEGPLRAVLFPGPRATLGERPEWCRAAFAAMGPDTAVSLWVLPRLGGRLAFELAALGRRQAGPDPAASGAPALAKAAPCTGALALALGPGPTRTLLEAVLRQDRPRDLEDPPAPVFLGTGGLTPGQDRARRAELEAVRLRRTRLQALRRQVAALAADLDLGGAALYWDGWAPAPALTAAERTALAEFNRLRRDLPRRATDLQRRGRAGFFGGYGEPGLAPSLALAVAVRPGRAPAVRAALGRILPLAFQGRPERRRAGGVDLHRIRTAQAFAPAWALAGGVLVLGSDDGPVAAVAAGLMGRVPTLADRPVAAPGAAGIGAAGIGAASLGQGRLDGARVAAHLETLLLAYRRAVGEGSAWWWQAPPAGDDEAGTEVAAVFGPFLGALRGLGQPALRLEWGPGGLVAGAGR